MKCFRVGLPCYLELNSSLSDSIKRSSIFPEIFMACIFPQCFPVSHTGNTVSSVSFCFQDANYAYATRQVILTQNQACEQFQKFCKHKQESTWHLIFASNSSKDQILWALSNWMVPFDTPYLLLPIACIDHHINNGFLGAVYAQYEN